MLDADRPPSPSELADRVAKADDAMVDDATLAAFYAEVTARYNGRSTELPTTPVCHSFPGVGYGPVEISIPPAFWRDIPGAWAQYERGHHASWMSAYATWTHAE